MDTTAKETKERIDTRSGWAHPKVRLVGEDDNAFAIMGRVMRELKKVPGIGRELAAQYREEATAGDYEHLLAVTLEYVDEDCGEDEDEDEDQVHDVDDGSGANFTPDQDAGHTSDRYNVGTDYPGTRLRAAFQALAEKGLLAKMRYMCCSSCAGYSLATEAGALVKAIMEGTATDARPILGCVFYHQQDADRFRSDNGMYLGFGQLHSAEHGAIGLDTVAVGKMVVDALRNAGVGFKWNGTEGERIWVECDSALGPAKG